MTKFISGLILAAGTSSRMGQPKQLLPFRGTILLDWVMAQAESASALDEVIVVLGRAADEIRPRLRNTRARVIINPVFTEGCSGSYKAGMATIDPRAEAVMVLRDPGHFERHRTWLAQQDALAGTAGDLAR